MGNLLNEAGFTMDTIFALADTTEKLTKMSKGYSYSSVAQAASKLIAAFPVIASRSVSPDTARMATKYIEQISCQFIMLALQAANIDSAESGIAYLRKFHQNLDIGDNGIESFASAMQSWIDTYHMAESAVDISSEMRVQRLTEDVDFSSILESDDSLKISPKDMRELLEVMKANENIQFYDTNLNPISINDYAVKESFNGDYHVSIRYPVIEAYSSDFERDEDRRYKEQQKEEERRYKEQQEKKQYKRNRRDKNKDENSKRRYNERMKKEERRYEEEKNAPHEFGRNVSILKDQDIKKMNDSVPSLLVVKFYQKGENNHVSSVATEFLIGVKAKLIPVDTTEVLRRIMNDNKDGKKFIKFMRAITGELKASELIFGLSRITDDVKSCKVKGAYGDIWNLLVNRAAVAKKQVKYGLHNDFSAITTVLISKYDADELFVEENLDINDPRNALHFMSSYNLMAFGIVDDSTESMKIMFDNGSKTFEEISYRMLERDTQDGTYKKLINLMAASR